jgi:cell division protein FtsL
MKKNNSTSQAFRQVPWRSQVHILVLVSVILVAIGIVSAFLLNITSQTSQNGRDIQVMQQEIGAIELENSALQAEWAELTSYKNMQARAADLRFDPVDPEEIEFIVVAGYYGEPPPRLASLNRPPLTSEQRRPVEYTESVFTWLTDVIHLQLEAKP